MILWNVENELMTPPKRLLTCEIDLEQCQGRYLANMAGDKNKPAISDHLRSDHDVQVWNVSERFGFSPHQFIIPVPEFRLFFTKDVIKINGKSIPISVFIFVF